MSSSPAQALSAAEVKRYFRKIIRIRAEDSPNVRLGMAQAEAGMIPTGEEVVPGVLGYWDYLKRRKTWDPVRQCIGLDAQFWEGAEFLMFPPDWLNRAEQLEAGLRTRTRQAKAIGVDPGEGVANTTFTAVDELGIVEQESVKTPNTQIIPGLTIAFGQRFDVPPDMWGLDTGGGGKQHADVLRANGYQVMTVAFGGMVDSGPRLGVRGYDDKLEVHEERYVYKNKRAEMYGMVRKAIQPPSELERRDKGFCIPARFTELRRQLSLIPLLYDGQGRMYLPPKNRTNPRSTERTLTEIIGCSPDEADSLVVAVYVMSKPVKRPTAGAF